MARIVVGITGASGTRLGHLAIQAIVDAGFEVDLILTKAALVTASLEVGPQWATPSRFCESLGEARQERVVLHPIGSISSTIASGSYRTAGMLVIPCSMATLAAIALGLADNLLRRAADVTLKEKRPFVVVPRETPLSEIHLEHMLKISRIGGSIVPPVPAWYTRPKDIVDVERFVVGRALDALKIDHALYAAWNGPALAADV